MRRISIFRHRHSTRSSGWWKRGAGIVLVVVVAIVSARFILFRPRPVEAAWYNDTWKFRVKLTIDHTKVGADQTDFPVYVDLSMLPQGFHDHVNKTDARDIRVTKADGSTELPREVVWYTASARKGELYFKYSGTLSSSTDTSVYIYYGNISATDYAASATYGKNNVWDSNYVGVWHLNETSSTRFDSTSKAHDLSVTSTVGTTTGPLGVAATFTQAGHLSRTDANLSTDFPSKSGQTTTNMSVSYWLKPTTLGFHDWLGKEISDGWYFYDGSDDMRFNYYSGSEIETMSGNTLKTAKWTYITGVHNSATDIDYVYLDGAESVNDTGRTGDPNASTADFVIGGTASFPNDANGSVDEVRISKTARSATWISTEYNNQRSPLAFFTSTRVEEQNRAPSIYFSFDEGYGTTANDSSVNHMTGTLSGATKPSWESEASCISGKCLSFGGSNAYVSVDTTGMTTLSSKFSVSVWVLGNTLDSTYRRIISRDSNPSQAWYIENDGSVPGRILYFGGGSGGQDSSGTIMEPNKWYHIEMVNDGTNTSLYVNGKLDTDVSFSGSVGTTGNIGIGGDPDGSDLWKGKIDDVKIYDYARTPAQVKEDYLSRGAPAGAAARFGSDLGSVLSNGLVGYWKMDENTGTTTADSSGNGNTGTFTNTPAWTIGKYGSGVYFDPAATNKYINVPAATSINNLAAFTVSVWVNPSQLQNRDFFNKGPGFELYFESVSSGLRTQFYMQCSGDDISIFSTSEDNLSLNVWHHIVVTYDGAGCGFSNVIIYIDGVPNHVHANSSVGTGTKSPDSSYPLQWGNYHDGTAQLQGSLDEGRVYNRALSPSEVRQLYAFAPGPVGWWKMDENTGTIANDSSNNNIVGTLANNPSWSPGKFGSGVLFSDTTTDKYISAASAASLNDMSQFTYEAWIKTGPKLNSAGEYIFSKGANVSLRISEDLTGQFRFRSSIVFNGGASEQQILLTSATNITPNTWYHVVLTWDGTTTHSTNHIYINGVDKVHHASSTDGSGSKDSDAASVVKIGNSTTNTKQMVGIMDDFKIYNYVRSPGQIVEDMNGGHPAPGSPVGSSVAYWKMDEGYGTTAYDSSINALNLTLSAASWNTDGKYGKAWNGDGARYASIADASTADKLDFAATDDFTIGMWIKSDSTTNPSATEYILSKAEASAGYRIFVENDSTGSVSFGIDDDTGWTPGDKVNSGTDIYDTAWHHVAAVKIGTTKIQLYVDGRLSSEDTSIIETGTLANAITLYLGDRNGANGGDEFFGDIDEVKIFRSALTSDEIKVLYNQGSGAVVGSLSTDSSGNASFANRRSYCPPGNTETNCSGSSDPSPLGEWMLDEALWTNNCSTATAVDTSSNGLSLTSCPNGTGPTGGTIGKHGNSGYFDGSDDYLESTSSTLNLSSVISMSAWVKPMKTPAGDVYVINKTNNNAGYSLGWQSDLKPRLQIGNGTAYAIITGNTVMTIGTWYHIAGTADASGNGVLYVNGKIDNTGSVGVLATTVGQNFRIGYRAAANAVTGNIDEVRVYNYVRTPAQVAWEYDRGGPVGWWKLDECSGGTANNSGSGGSSLNGTLTGTGSTNTGNGTCTDVDTATKWYNGKNGKYNASLDFDGGDDYVTVTDPGTSSALDMASSFSLAQWVKWDSTSGEQYIITKGDSSVSNYWIAKGGDSFPSGVECGFYNGSIGNTTGLNVTFTSGQWYHLACVFDDANNVMKFYIDGIERSSTSVTDAPSDTVNNGDLRIGRERASYGLYMNGQVDDVRVYTYPLSLQQVKMIVNEAASVRFGPLTGSP